MSDTITIAIDAMGGDGAPGIVLKGAEIALQRHPELRYERTNLTFRAEQQIANAGISLQRDLGTFQHDARSAIAAHRIDRNRNGVAHRARPLNRVCRSRPLRWRRDHLAPVVVPARLAKMVRTLQLTAIGAFRIGGRFEPMVRAPHVAA